MTETIKLMNDLMQDMMLCICYSFYFITLISRVSQSQTLNFNVVQKGIPIYNLQLLIDHKTEVNHIFHP